MVFCGFHVREARSERVQLESLGLLNNAKARLAAFQALSHNISGERDIGYEWPYFDSLTLDEAKKKGSIVPTMDVSPLHVSSLFGLKQAGRIILNERTNINEFDGVGGSAVHWAIRGEQNETLEFLLKAGADPNIS